MNIKEAGANTGWVLAAIFALIGIASLISQEWLNAALWLLISIGMAISITKTPEEWRARPLWQRGAAIGVTMAAFALLIIRIVSDFLSNA